MTFYFLFEQSGTFKNEAKKLGFNAYDFDISNECGCTDFVIDLFCEIEKAYNGQNTFFDDIKAEDIIMAFFPCIRFSRQEQLNFMGVNNAMKEWSLEKKLLHSMQAHKELNYLYEMVSKLVIVCLRKQLKLVIENPYSKEHYLFKYWCVKPEIIDFDRSMHGDFFKKPTLYYFFGFKPYYHLSLEFPLYANNLKKVDSVCRFERSLMSSYYAYWFLTTYLIDGEV